MIHFVVRYMYSGKLYEVEVPSLDGNRGKAERRAFWQLASYLKADLDALRAGFAGSEEGRLRS
jgi:hypothetical protein